MSSVNKVILLGRIGRDPEVRYLPSGEAVANLAMATSEVWKDKQGEKQEKTEWHRISFFGRLAEVCGEYVKKGSLLYIEGSISTRKYTDKDGIEKYATEIKGREMQMLGGRNDRQEAPQQAAPAPAAQPPRQAAPSQPSPAPRAPGGFEDMDDDQIPFNDPMKSRAFCLVV